MKAIYSITNRKNGKMREIHPQTNYGHRKLVYLPDTSTLVVGMKACAKHIGISYDAMYKAIKEYRSSVKGIRFEVLSVETNGDECNRVGRVLSYRSKCATTEKSAEEIVHSDAMAKHRVNDQGVIDLCYRSGEVTLIQAKVVYEKDTFEYEFGLDPKLRHIPYRGDDPGKPIYYYGVFKTKGGASGFEVMSYEQVMEHAKKFSKSYSSDNGVFYGPWGSDFDSMAKKTVLLQALKYAPKKSDFARALSSDATTKSTLAKDMTEVKPDEYIDADVVEASTPKESQQNQSTPSNEEKDDLPDIC